MDGIYYILLASNFVLCITVACLAVKLFMIKTMKKSDNNTHQHHGAGTGSGNEDTAAPHQHRGPGTGNGNEDTTAPRQHHGFGRGSGAQDDGFENVGNRRRRVLAVEEGARNRGFPRPHWTTVPQRHMKGCFENTSVQIERCNDDEEHKFDHSGSTKTTGQGKCNQCGLTYKVWYEIDKCEISRT